MVPQLPVVDERREDFHPVRVQTSVPRADIDECNSEVEAQDILIKVDTFCLNDEFLMNKDLKMK